MISKLVIELYGSKFEESGYYVMTPNDVNHIFPYEVIKKELLSYYLDDLYNLAII